MAKASKSKASVNPGNVYIFAAVFISFVLLAFSIAVVRGFGEQAGILSKYELLEKLDNQACRYLNNQPEVNGSFDLDTNAPDDMPKLTYACDTGQKVQAREIHGKPIGEYLHGASVMYFSSNQAAEKFAETKVNPQRYWGVDSEGQKQGIPQSSLFTFIVTDAEPPYFDAYTVKANAILRVSLRCSNQADIQNCYEEAHGMLNRELKGVNVL